MHQKTEVVGTKKQKILFIINPVAGTRKKRDIPSTIYDHTDKEKFDIKLIFTEYPGHGHFIAKEGIKKEYDVIVAAGGDGTVNEIGKALVNSQTALAIIPIGSGNGLARHLQIPLKITDAIKAINTGSTKTIDYGIINDKIFFCTAGVGFDAKIGHKFAKTAERGFYGYFRATLEEYMTYKPKKYKITIDGEKISVRAFLVTAANASQYGNNAYISPDALIDDGLLDICVLKPFPKNRVFGIGIRLFNRTLDQSPFLEIHRGKNVFVKRKKKGPAHFDGEPVKMGKKVEISIVAKGLKILVPDN